MARYSRFTSLQGQQQHTAAHSTVVPPATLANRQLPDEAWFVRSGCRRPPIVWLDMIWFGWLTRGQNEKLENGFKNLEGKNGVGSWFFGSMAELGGF
jgi:hypothetical protein